jgi:hypothetical protein
MGWYKIDPATGKPLNNSPSALSKPPDFVLLNAVPGVDDEEAATYLGDGPWYMASTVCGELAEALPNLKALSDDQLRDLLLNRKLPPGTADAETGDEVLDIVDAFWDDIDSCYEDDWDRPANAAEKRWVCEYVIEGRQNQ